MSTMMRQFSQIDHFVSSLPKVSRNRPSMSLIEAAMLPFAQRTPVFAKTLGANTCITF